MYLSIREKYISSERGWTKYIEFLGLNNHQGLSEVMTLDRALNPIIDKQEEGFSGIDSIQKFISKWPSPQSDKEYIQLAINLTNENLPVGIPCAVLLGFDLADNTWTSSLLNC